MILFIRAPLYKEILNAHEPLELHYMESIVNVIQIQMNQYVCCHLHSSILHSVHSFLYMQVDNFKFWVCTTEIFYGVQMI